MIKIEGFRVTNFRVLKDVALGWLPSTPQVEPLTPMTGVIGKNGVGKSTLFDAFGFLADCLKSGVEEACYLHGRGGFKKIRSQGQTGPIKFEVSYFEEPRLLCNGFGIQPPLDICCVSYRLEITLDESGRPYVYKELLNQVQRGQEDNPLLFFLTLDEGKGFTWKSEIDVRSIDIEAKRLDNNKLNKGFEERIEERVELEDKRKLGIATLGALKQHPNISRFRQFIEDWYLSYFTPDAARSLPLAGPQRHLNMHGDNLGNVVQYMEREHKDSFKRILASIAKKIPGINKIDTEKTSDGRLLLRFNDKGFKDPFYAQQMSDGTLKVFAYLLLLEDPTPPPFICIEEPENGLYHKLLETLAREFREHATGKKGGSQVFITTHQPYLVDALEPNEVWVLEKGENGFATIRRASDDPIVKGLVAEGLPLGGLWYSDYLDAR